MLNFTQWGTIKTYCFEAKQTLFEVGNKMKWKIEMMNYKNLQKICVGRGCSQL